MQEPFGQQQPARGEKVVDRTQALKDHIGIFHQTGKKMFDFRMETIEHAVRETGDTVQPLNEFFRHYLNEQILTAGRLGGSFGKVDSLARNKVTVIPLPAPPA